MAKTADWKLATDKDLDPKAIADLLSISNGSVRRHLARGKTHLKETLHADD